MEIPLTDEQSVPPPLPPVLPPVRSPAQRASAGEDRPCCGTGLGHHAASSAMNCRFIPPSQLLQGGVQLRLKEKKDSGPA